MLDVDPTGCLRVAAEADLRNSAVWGGATQIGVSSHQARANHYGALVPMEAAASQNLGNATHTTQQEAASNI